MNTKPNPIGRPKRFQTQMAVRANREQIDHFAAAARASGLNMSDWIRVTLASAAAKALRGVEKK